MKDNAHCSICNETFAPKELVEFDGQMLCPYCDNCHAEYRNSRPTHDYYNKPAPIFYGEGNRFMGVELEIDEAGERDSYAAAITDLANFNGVEHIYCKHDGSLDDGIEIVTHPI